MKIVFKALLALAICLGYSAWGLWCYGKFGFEMTSYCLGSWCFMIVCKLVIGVVIYEMWLDLFSDYDTGIPKMKNPIPPPPRRTDYMPPPPISKETLEEMGRDTTDVFKYMGHGK